MKRLLALLLFSEGLDSILAGKLLMAQGIDVLAIRFITPFFGWHWKGKEEEFLSVVQEKFGFSGKIIDITEEFLDILCLPRHGYGSVFNPCIDCRILMLQKARDLMPIFDAKFLVTGEVVSQRPMTQRRNIMRHIEKEAGVDGILLRPLSAKILPETKIEKEGLVDRTKLLSISGRGRKVQLKLAKRFGLKEIPSPSGGCLLTDPNLTGRFRAFLAWKGSFTPREAELLTFGRHFQLDRSWLVLGRTERENKRLNSLFQDQDILIKLANIPGPTGLLLGNVSKKDIIAAGGLIKQYAPKARSTKILPIRIISHERDEIIFLDEKDLLDK